jgi:hypothetical protein
VPSNARIEERNTQAKLAGIKKGISKTFTHLKTTTIMMIVRMILIITQNSLNAFWKIATPGKSMTL